MIMNQAIHLLEKYRNCPGCGIVATTSHLK